MIAVKLKGGALYVSIIISILVSIILSLFILIAYFNLKSVQSQASLSQLQLSLESGFEIAKSEYFSSLNEGSWQKMSYNNDSVIVSKTPWGCFTLIDVKAKNTHFKIQQTGLFGCNAFRDTALMIADQNRLVSLAGKIKFNGYCYLPKAGLQSAYIEGTTFSDLNSVREYIKPSPSYIPGLNPTYLKDIEFIQNQLNNYSDSLLSFIPDNLNQSFKHKTTVIQQGSIVLSNIKLSNNIKLIAANSIIVENNCELNNVLLIARKIIFKTKFKGNVHVIAKDSIITEDNCEFNYPSSFCVYSNAPSKTENPSIRGIFFGKECKFKGGLLAANDKLELSRMMIKVNSKFEFIGNLYSSNYAEVQGNLYGSIFCQTLLLQTPSGIYENHLLNCNINPKKYNTHLVVPDWFLQKEKRYVCAQWF